MQQSATPQPIPQRPRRSSVGGLIALNAALLLLLGAVTFGPSARAQQRPHGDYTMVGGTVAGSAADVVFIVDSFNQEMIGVTLDPSTRLLDPVGYRNLTRDAANALMRRGG